MADDRSEVELSYCVGTFSGGCDVIDNEPLGAGSTVVVRVGGCSSVSIGERMRGHILRSVVYEHYNNIILIILVFYNKDVMPVIESFSQQVRQLTVMSVYKSASESLSVQLNH